MIIALSAIFLLSYAAIALEHPLHVNKSATALIGAGLLWTIYVLFSGGDIHTMVHDELGLSLIHI